MAGDISLKRPDVVGARSYGDDSQTFSRVSWGQQLSRSATVATTEARACNANRKSLLRSLFVLSSMTLVGRVSAIYLDSLIIPEIIALLYWFTFFEIEISNARKKYCIIFFKFLIILFTGSKLFLINDIDSFMSESDFSIIVAHRIYQREGSRKEERAGPIAFFAIRFDGFTMTGL